MKKIYMCVFVVLLTLTMHSLIGQAAEEYYAEPEQAGIFQGKILEIVDNDLVLETTNREVLRVSLTGEIAKRGADFRVKEMVEIDMTPGGIATSVISVPGGVEP